MIVDEAHSFQSGKSAQAMTDALTREASDSEDVEDLILEYQRARGPYAKAMVVTQSREHALRYWQGLGRYIEKQGYGGLNALVAFSDTLEIDGVPWTEAEANGFPETELPRRFEGDEFQILVVAEKYQTGFDQPKLCGMYVDRPLHGLRAVQTLSRLNRAALGKRRTYVLDFRNTQEEIQSAFKPFFEVTQLEDRSDPNQIYDLSQRIMSASYVDPDEVEAFSRLFFSGPLATADRMALEGYVRHAVERFLLDEDDAAQEEFRQLLKSFMRFYVFVAQIIRLEDTRTSRNSTPMCHGWRGCCLPAIVLLISRSAKTCSISRRSGWIAQPTAPPPWRRGTLCRCNRSRSLAPIPRPKRKNGLSLRLSRASTDAMARRSRPRTSCLASRRTGNFWTET